MILQPFISTKKKSIDYKYFMDPSSSKFTIFLFLIFLACIFLEFFSLKYHCTFSLCIITTLQSENSHIHKNRSFACTNYKLPSISGTTCYSHYCWSSNLLGTTCYYHIYWLTSLPSIM